MVSAEAKPLIPTPFGRHRANTERTIANLFRASYLKANSRPPKGGQCVGVISICLELLLGSLFGCLGSTGINVLTQFTDIRENRHSIIGDFDETLMNRNLLLRTVHQDETHWVSLQRSDKGNVARLKGNIAIRDASDHHGGLAAIRDSLWRNQLDVKRHYAFFSSSFALRNTSSAPPTL